MSVDPNLVLERLREFDARSVEDSASFRGELTIHIRREKLRKVCEFLRDAEGLDFKYLSDLTALDNYPNEPRFETVYQLYCIARNERLRLKTRISGDDPRVDSMVPVWPGANAFEREVFDLFGIHFDGHPYLVRIVMPEEWEGHPLRKDYPTEGYR